MAYTPAIVGTEDYGAVRQALGFAATDTTNVPDALIEGRAFLPQVERSVKARFASWADIIDSGHAQYVADKHETLQDGVVLATAAYVALYWFDARTGEEVTRTGVGPYVTNYRSGPEWQAVADTLLRAAATMFERVRRWGASVDSMTIAGRSGPTRAAEDADTSMSTTDWAQYLEPPVVRGYEYYDWDS